MNVEWKHIIKYICKIASLYLLIHSIFVFIFAVNAIDKYNRYALYFLKFMKKQELLIQILEKLTPYWSEAENMLFLVKEYYDDNFADKLLISLSKHIKQIQQSAARDKLEQARDLVKKIQQKEREERNEEDIEKLLLDI